MKEIVEDKSEEKEFPKAGAIPSCKDEVTVNEETVDNEELTLKDEQQLSVPVSLQNEDTVDEGFSNEGEKLSSNNQRVEVLPAATGLDVNRSSDEYVYAVGLLRPEFASESGRKEFERVAAELPSETSSKEVSFYEVLIKPENFYLTKLICWIFEIGGIETYVVVPRDSNQLKKFIKGIEPVKDTTNKFDTLVGGLGPIAPPEMCNGRTLSTVRCNQLESFFFDTFTQYIQGETNIQLTSVQNLFLNMLRLTDNSGSSGAHRAINFMTFSYPDLYRILGSNLSSKSATEQIFPFNGVTAKQAETGGERKKMEVVFKFENPDTSELEYQHCEVDVTDQYPFMTVNLTSGNPED